MNLIKTILILALIYYGVRIFSRMVFPWLLKTFARRVQRKMQDQMNQQQTGRTGFKQEGEILVKRPQKSSKDTREFDGGEYIDFEEVEDGKS